MKILILALLTLTLSVASFAQVNNGDFLRFKNRIGFDDEKERIMAKNYSADGTRLTLIGLKSIQTWDVPNAKLIESHPHEIVQLDKLFGTFYKFSPDGTRVVTLDSIGRDGDKKEDRVNAYVYDVATGKQIAILERPDTSVRYAFWSDNGATLVTFSGLYNQKRTEISFWNGADLAFRKSINVDGYTWHYFTRDGEKLFVGNGGQMKVLGLSAGASEGGAIRAYNTRTGALEKEFNDGGTGFEVSDPYTFVSADERFIATKEDKNVLVWDTKGAAKPLYKLTARTPKNRVSLEGFSEDGKYLLAYQDKTAEYYDAASGKLLTNVPAVVKIRRNSKYVVPNEFVILAYNNLYREEDPVLETPDGKYAVARNCESTSVFHLTTDQPLYSVKGKCIGSGNIVDTTLNRRTDSSNIVNNDFYYTQEVFRISPNGKLLINFRYNQFTVRDLKTGAVLQTIERKQDKNLMNVPKWNLQWDIKGKDALTVSEDRRSILIWEINEG